MTFGDSIARVYTGVIIFASDQEVMGVMRAVRRNNATGQFSWIGSDGWAGRTMVSDGNEAEVEGTLSFLPQVTDRSQISLNNELGFRLKCDTKLRTRCDPSSK